MEERTDHVRRDVVALAASGAGVGELHAGAGPSKTEARSRGELVARLQPLG